MPVKFVGRESHFYGKTLFEIARNLKNFGVGRVVMRTKYNKQYPDEVTYYRLTKVEPDMNSKYYLKGTAAGRKVFRGYDYGEKGISAGHKRDWILIPKDQEHFICGEHRPFSEKLKEIHHVPSNVPIPPLMQFIFKSEIESFGLKAKDWDFNARIQTVRKRREYSDRSDSTVTSHCTRESSRSSENGVKGDINTSFLKLSVELELDSLNELKIIALETDVDSFRPSLEESTLINCQSQYLY